ncbi:hypothetical protein ALT785_490004 [Alteromonas infernus]
MFITPSGFICNDTGRNYFVFSTIKTNLDTWNTPKSTYNTIGVYTYLT